MARVRTRFLLATAALAGLLLVAAASGRPVGGGAGIVAADAIEQPVLARINQARHVRGLRPLRLAESLERAAEGHARSMLRQGYFSHSSPDGTPPAARIHRFYPGATVGETILWRSPDAAAEEAVQMWLASPPHRAILLSSGFREIGLAAMHSAAAPGTFNLRPVTVLVADFGAR